MNSHATNDVLQEVASRLKVEKSVQNEEVLEQIYKTIIKSESEDTKTEINTTVDYVVECFAKEEMSENLMANCDVNVNSVNLKTSYAIKKKVREDNVWNIFECTICARAFSHINMLNTHLMLHCDAGTLCCQICGSPLTLDKILKKYMIMHYNNHFECKLCNKLFYSLKAIKFHFSKHSAEIKFLCAGCQQKYTIASFVKSYNVPGMTLNKFKCPICYKIYKLKQHFQTHMDMHSAKPEIIEHQPWQKNLKTLRTYTSKTKKMLIHQTK